MSAELTFGLEEIRTMFGTHAADRTIRSWCQGMPKRMRVGTTAAPRFTLAGAAWIGAHALLERLGRRESERKQHSRRDLLPVQLALIVAQDVLGETKTEALDAVRDALNAVIHP